MRDLRRSVKAPRARRVDDRLVAHRRLTELDLPPDMFAVVMATGIVSVAADEHAYPRISIPLAVLAVAAMCVLVAGLVIRVLARPRSAFGEVRDPDVALRLFTSVAACAVLAARFESHPAVNWVLGISGLAGWLVLVPLAARDVISRPRTELRDHAHGAWLLPSVATAGLAVTAADLAVGENSVGLVMLAALAWLLGLLAYVAVTWLIAWRAAAAPFIPEQVTPDSWILMGALAISTLAGDRVIAAAQRVGEVHWLVAVARPVTLGTWIVASLWIPVLLYAELWRADRVAGSLHFAGVWWSAVFPLGMYAVATEATARRLQLPSLTTMSLVFCWLAVSVWLLVTVGLIHRAIAASITGGSRDHSANSAPRRPPGS
ncbi:MAG: tellurite resistance/C4-dicarboxylate transporter family protein [Jatrophihabitantaceae bacterium]